MWQVVPRMQADIHRARPTVQGRRKLVRRRASHRVARPPAISGRRRESRGGGWFDTTMPLRAMRPAASTELENVGGALTPAGLPIKPKSIKRL